jgi:hypothetical protein
LQGQCLNIVLVTEETEIDHEKDEQKNTHEDGKIRYGLYLAVAVDDV